MDEAGFRSRNIVAALGGHDVFIKKVELPRMNEAEARRAIRREAERHVPFDLEEVRLDFQILPPRDTTAHMEALLVAAKRERVDDRVALLADAGIRATAMDVEAFALHNAFVHNYPETADGVVALVNVGRDVTNLNVIEEGVPVLVKDLPLGSRKVAESLQREFRLTEEQAEQVLQGHQPLQGVQRVVADGVALGIRRAAAYLGGRRSGAGVGRIFPERRRRLHAGDGRGSRRPGASGNPTRQSLRASAAAPRGARPTDRRKCRADAVSACGTRLEGYLRLCAEM